MFDQNFTFGRKRRRGGRVRMVARVLSVSEQVPPPPFRVYDITNYGKAEGRILMALTLTDSQQATLSIGFTDKRGNAAPQPPGTLAWFVDNPAVLSITPAADNLTCLVAAAGPLGSATVTVKLADADGATTAAGTLDVNVTGGSATNIAVTAGPPEEQP